MVWSISVDMSNNNCREEVMSAFNGASERTSLFDRFDAFQWPDMANVFTLTTKNNDSAAFADYQKVEQIVKNYPSLLNV